MPWQTAQRAEHFPPLDLRRHRAGVKLLLDGDQQLADTEQAHHGDDEVDALHQFIDAHGEPHAAGHGIDADRRDGKSDRQRDDGFYRRRPAHADEAGEGQEVDREIFRRSERQRHLRDPGGEKGNQDDADQRAERRRSERGGERGGRPAVARHRIAVERGRDR